MPAPDHILPILAALGDGGTVPLAEKVHVIVEQARAEERSARPFDWASGYVGRDVYDQVVQVAERLGALRDRTLALLDRWADSGDVVSITAVLAELTGVTTAPIADLIEASSLGTPEAKAARESVPIEEARAVVERAKAGAAPPAELTAADYRAWAADAKVPCPKSGTIPKRVRDAYDAAHQPAEPEPQGRGGDDWLDDITDPEAGTEGAGE